MTIIEVITEQPLTVVEVNSFRSVPVGINLTASGDGTLYLTDDGTYKTASGGGGGGNTNLSITNKTSTTFDLLSSTGTDVTIPQASISEAGLLVASDKVKLNNLGTASSLNVPSSGNAASGEVVKGDDTRLSDARTPLSHNHTIIIADVTGLQTALDGKFNNPVGDTTQYVAGDGSLISFPVAGQSGTLVRQVRNETGSPLTKGSVVYLLGASGNKPLALRAIANSAASSDRTFGIVQADIPNNNNGYVVVSGVLVGVDTSSFTEGAIIYLSGTVAGGVTTVQPTPPIHSVILGVVTRSHATQGQFDVSIQNGFEVEDLHDALITSKTNKDVLSYESASGLWKNKQLNASDVSDFNAAADARVVAGITGKENTIAAGTTAQYWRGDKSWQTLDKTVVGLANVDNTSDTNKPISTATQTALNLKYDASNPNGYTTNLGTVTTASVVSANGFAGSVATAGTTPAITISTSITGLLKGNGIAISAASAGTDYLSPTGNGSGLTDFTSGQVTTALGFTPYNATNPSGYTSNTGTVTTASIVTANGFSGSVATASTTPAITLTLQNATGAQSGQLTSTDWNTFNSKQDVLVSGNNIKTVNGNSLLGSGDLIVSSRTTVDVDFGSSFTDKAQVVVTGQSWVTPTSSISCQVLCPTASDPDELYLLNIRPVISSLVNGVGFTLTLYSEQEAKGIYKVMCVGV